MLCVVDGCRICLAGVEPISQSWNPVRRRGIWFFVVESGSSSWNPVGRCGIRFFVVESGSLLWNPVRRHGRQSSLLNLLRCRWIVVVVKSASPTLNLSCRRRSYLAVVDPVSSNPHFSCQTWVWWYFVACYCGLAFGTRLVSRTEGIREQKRATTFVVAHVW